MGTTAATRASGKKRAVLARYVRNHRLADALHQQAFCALNASPGARAYYDQLRARGTGHHAALRQLSNRLVGILHGCLKTRISYDEDTAWGHPHQARSTSCCLTTQLMGCLTPCGPSDPYPGNLPPWRQGGGAPNRGPFVAV